MSSSKKETITSRETKEIIEDINKKYREGIISTLGESKFKDYPTLSTGSLILDRESEGGYPLGKIIEIYGENSSGKTTLALHAVRECQKLGKRAVWFDVENALIAKNAQNIGVNIDKLLVLYPSTGEETFKLITDFIKEKEEKKKRRKEEKKKRRKEESWSNCSWFSSSLNTRKNIGGFWRTGYRCTC